MVYYRYALIHVIYLSKDRIIGHYDAIFDLRYVWFSR